MGYCFMTIQKVKNLGTLKSKYIHNYRETDVPNADPDCIDENEELVKLLDENGNATDYVEKFKERVKDIPKYRKDAVRAFEVVTTFSRETDIDIESWKKANVEWLKETFNKAGDGKDNVISVMYHGDETGNVHCHAIVIPIDENGRLNASHYTNGRLALVKMQDTYAKKMKQFNLERGLEGSNATHKQIRNFYASLNNAKKKIPPVRENESAAEYRKRAVEELMAAHNASLGEIDRKRRRMEQKIAKERKLEKDAWKKEYASSREVMRTEVKELQNKIDEAKKEESRLNENIKSLASRPETEIALKLKHAEQIQNKIELLKLNDPDYFNSVKNYVESIEDKLIEEQEL